MAGSLGGLLTASLLLLFNREARDRVVPWLVSYAVGTLLGVALLDLVPQALGKIEPTPAFTALLRHVAWLSGDQTKERRAATLAGARAAGISDAVVADMIALEQRQDVRTADPARLFPDYIGAVEQLARAVDAWRV